MVRLNEVPYEIQDLFTGGRGSGDIWTFVQRVDNKVDRDLSWEIDHGLETFHERSLAGLFGAEVT